MEELRVYAFRSNGDTYYKVESVEEARLLIESLANNDLKCESIVWNTFGLEKRDRESIRFAKDQGYFKDTLGWEDWRDEDGYSLDDLKYKEDNLS